MLGLIWFDSRRHLQTFLIVSKASILYNRAGVTMCRVFLHLVQISPVFKTVFRTPLRTRGGLGEMDLFKEDPFV